MSFLARLRSVARPAALPRLRPAVSISTSVRAPFALRLARGLSTTFLERKEVESRVLNVLKSFPKVDQSKVAAGVHFTKDLGLDSLDEVELVMALEDEFKLEIPDAEAEKIHSVNDAINYLAGNPQAK